MSQKKTTMWATTYDIASVHQQCPPKGKIPVPSWKVGEENEDKSRMKVKNGTELKTEGLRVEQSR